jgi:FkbH-like protein
MEIAPAAAAHYGELVVRLVEAHRGRSRKCLVLDLDDTLWGGTIGDDGPEGIVIGPGSARGEAHHELQHHARLLAQRGVILAVCSKNDPALAETVFEEHPAMALRRQDFAAFIANWDDKATNLQRIAAQLNIGLDSLVFVDNSPAERARIRESLPMVAVPELPDDPAGYVRCLSGAGYFEAVSFTAEDGQRAHGYVADAQRSELRAAAQSMEAYLRGLDMRLHAGVVRPLDLPRAAQLIAKTNQFNATGRRYGPEDIRALAADGGIALQFRLADRFGDNGLVSVMLLVPLAAESGAYELGNWVMSCRVFGRQLEAEALNVAVEQLRARSARTLYVQYVPTPRNGPMADLFSRLGFSRAPCVDPETTATRWLLEIEAYRPSATCIARMDA